MVIRTYNAKNSECLFYTHLKRILICVEEFASGGDIISLVNENLRHLCLACQFVACSKVKRFFSFFKFVKLRKDDVDELIFFLFVC